MDRKHPKIDRNGHGKFSDVVQYTGMDGQHLQIDRKARARVSCLPWLAIHAWSGSKASITLGGKAENILV